jgi:glycine cleavage system aminomethyltransferase T
MGVKLSRRVRCRLNLSFDENGAEAGNITSVVYIQEMQSIIGLAYIRKAFAEDGRELL